MSSFTNTNRDLSKYTNINKWNRSTNSYIGIEIADKITQKNGQDYKLVDAVDIDWNGIYIPQAETYINHTEDLAKLLGNMININNFNDVSVRIDRAEITLEEIIYSYVSKEYLSNTLKDYQPLLKAGAYIDITDNTISTYNLLSARDIQNSFSTKNELNSFISEVSNNYFTKEGVKNFLNENIIKNADPNFNDLEKISNWIKKQSKFVEVDNTYIENHPDNTYYKYNSNLEEYIEVSIEEIRNNPDVKYYTIKDTNQDIEELIKRIDTMDDTVGHKNNDGSYTGILKDINQLYINDNALSSEIIYASEIAENADKTAKTSYTLAYDSYLSSYSSYNLAYNSYSYAIEAITYSSIAYSYVNELSEIIGHDIIPSHYEVLTEEDINDIKENGVSSFTYELYIKDGDNYYLMHSYNEEDGYEYYKKIPTQEETGFYKDLAETEKIANESLYNLSYTNLGDNTYAYITLSPDRYNGDVKRNIIFTFNTGDISEINGEIIKNGIITTLELKDSFAYLTYFERIPGEHDTDVDQ